MSEEKAIQVVKSWAHNPAKFVQEAILEPRGLNERPTAQQMQALDEVRKLVNAKIKLADGDKLTAAELEYTKKQGLSVMSGQGAGKDGLASWLIIWFLCCFPYPKIPCTAPTGHQLRDVLWSEVNKWLRGSLVKDWLVWQSDKIFFKESGGKEWFAVARTTNPKASGEEQAETLAGFHEDYLMVVCDEASGIPEPVFKPLEGTLTGRCNFIVLIFNPTRSKGFAIDSQYKDRSSWVCLHWDGEQSEMVSKEHVERMEKKYGRDSNAFRIRINGLPPTADEDVLIPWDWVMDAVDRDIEPTDNDPLVFGLDVGAGGDPSALLQRQGPKVYKLDTFDTVDSEKLTGWALGKIYDAEPSDVFIDIIGWGWGVAGNLKTRQHTAQVWDVNVAEAAAISDRFFRLRDELWWNVREKFEQRAISIPNDDELIGELTTIKYLEDGNGKIKVESKKDLKKRGLQSPNKADALCLTEYFHGNILKSMNQNRKKGRKLERVGWKTV